MMNEDSSLLDNTQFPNPSVNQYSKADSTLKPKEANDMLRDENKALNSKFDNEQNTQKLRKEPYSEKGITPCPFLKRRGWCVKGARCDFKHPREVQKGTKWCPAPFYKSVASVLKAFAVTFLIALVILIAHYNQDLLTNTLLLHCFTTIDQLWPHNVRHMGLVSISFPKITLGDRVFFNFTRNL